MMTNLASLQDALVSAVAAQVPAGVQVALGYPKGGPRDRTVWVSGEAEVTAVSESADMGVRQETANLQVLVYAVMTTAEYAPVRDACLALVAAVEAALAADRTLGGHALTAEVTALRVEEAVLSESSQRAVGATLTVSVTSLVA